MHGWILCRYCATGWFWWISGLRAVTMWSSSSFTKTVLKVCSGRPKSTDSIRQHRLKLQSDKFRGTHYTDVIMITMASQITSLTVVYSTVYSDADQRKHQSSASLRLCVGNSPGPVNSPHKGPVTRKMVPFDDVIMNWSTYCSTQADSPQVFPWHKCCVINFMSKSRSEKLRVTDQGSYPCTSLSSLQNVNLWSENTTDWLGSVHLLQR